MKSTGICSLVSFLGGILVGSMVAVLTTPQSGPDLRNKIRDYAQQEAEKMRCNCSDHK